MSNKNMRQVIRLGVLAYMWQIPSKVLIEVMNDVDPKFKYGGRISRKTYTASSVLYIEPNEKRFWETVKSQAIKRHQKSASNA